MPLKEVEHGCDYEEGDPLDITNKEKLAGACPPAKGAQCLRATAAEAAAILHFAAGVADLKRLWVKPP